MVPTYVISHFNTIMYASIGEVKIKYQLNLTKLDRSVQTNLIAARVNSNQANSEQEKLNNSNEPKCFKSELYPNGIRVM